MSDKRSGHGAFHEKARIWLWYAIGHAISVVSSWTPQGILWKLTYRPYNFCMNRSSDLDKYDWIWKQTGAGTRVDVRR